MADRKSGAAAAREASTADHQQVAVRVPFPIVKRVDALAERMGQPGLVVSRSEALRVALHRGLDAIEAGATKRGARKRVSREDEAGGLQTAVRLPPSTVQRVDAVAERMSQPGFVVARSEALRVALQRGLDVLEAEVAKRSRS